MNHNTTHEMNTEARFKYQAQIDELLAIGCQLPKLFAPYGLQACRFAFSGEAHPNHIDFYEYEACDLNKSFQITKVLMEEKPS